MLWLLTLHLFCATLDATGYQAQPADLAVVLECAPACSALECGATLPRASEALGGAGD